MDFNLDINLLLEYLSRDSFYDYLLNKSCYIHKENIAKKIYIDWIKNNSDEMSKFNIWLTKWYRHELL